MILKDDINRRIETDFREQSNEVVEILKNAIEKTEHLKTDRIIRCIIFLSKGNLNELLKNIEVAINDPRDIMLWAEYEKLSEDFNYKRKRDFDNTFEESSISLRE